MAQNVIVPVIDLTSAAEGSSVGVNLQTAISFDSQTAFSIKNTTTVIANTAGFWRVYGQASQFFNDSSDLNAKITMSDGLSVKTIWGMQTGITGSKGFVTQDFDITVFLNSGESISGVTNSNFGYLIGSSRQIADVNGNLVNPSGFSPQ